MDEEARLQKEAEAGEKADEEARARLHKEEPDATHLRPRMQAQPVAAQDAGFDRQESSAAEWSQG